MFRKFGIELEVFGVSRETARNILCSNGFVDWRIVYDFSVCGCGTAVCTTKCQTAEIVSPILESVSDLDKIKKVCQLLIENGAKVNNTCGLHVHIDARQLSGKECELIYRRYGAYESAIDLFHPVSRRKNNNNYCLSIKPILDTIKEDKIEFKSKKDLIEKTNGFVLGLDKYYKLNIISLAKFGSLEFRQHQGTINFDDIKNWINFCQGFVETSLTPVMKDSLFRGIDENTKNHYLRIMQNA